MVKDKKKEKEPKPDRAEKVAKAEKPAKVKLKKPVKIKEPKKGKGNQEPAGPGLDLSRAPGGADEFFLFVDEAGRLAYSANGMVSYISLESASKGDEWVDGEDTSMTGSPSEPGE
jgi:hypothetical protein